MLLGPVLCYSYSYKANVKFTTFFLKRCFFDLVFCHLSIAIYRCKYVLFIDTFSTGEAQADQHTHTQSPWKKRRNLRGPSRQQPQQWGMDSRPCTEKLVVLSLVSLVKRKLRDVCFKSISIWRLDKDNGARCCWLTPGSVWRRYGQAVADKLQSRH